MALLKKLWSGADFWDRDENRKQREEEARRAAQAASQPRQRNIASRAFDQVNPFDNNLTFKQAAPTQSKSSFQQAGQLGGQTARTTVGGLSRFANTAYAQGKQVSATKDMLAADALRKVPFMQDKANKDWSIANQKAKQADSLFKRGQGGILNTGTLYGAEDAKRGDLKTGIKRIGGGTLEAQLEAGTFGLGSFSGKQLVQQGLKQGLKRQLPTIGKNAVLNTAQGGVAAMNQGASIRDVAKSAAIGGTLGTVADVGLGVGAAGIRKAATSMPSAPKTAPPRVRARPDEVAALKGYLDNEYKLAPATPREQSLIVRDKQAAMQRLGIPQGRATELDNIRQYLDTTGTNKTPAYAVPKQPTSILERIKNSKLMQNEGGYVQIPGKKDPLDSLRQEARKYKSAEEFIDTDKTINVPIRDFPKTDTTSWNEALNNVSKGELSKTAGPVEVVLTPNGYKLVEGNHRAVQALQSGKDSIEAKIISKEGLEKIAQRDGPHIKMNMQDSLTRQQLTDLYSEATKPSLKDKLIAPFKEEIGAAGPGVGKLRDEMNGGTLLPNKAPEPYKNNVWEGSIDPDRANKIQKNVDEMKEFMKSGKSKYADLVEPEITKTKVPKKKSNEDFKTEAMKVRDNLKAGEKGYITDGGKTYEISRDSTRAKVVQTPKEAYHSTAALEIEGGKLRPSNDGAMGPGVYLHSNEGTAKTHAAYQGDGNIADQTAYKVKINTDKIHKLPTNNYPSPQEVAAIKASGSEGIMLKDGEMVIFDPNKVELATQPPNPDLPRRSQSPTRAGMSEEMNAKSYAETFGVSPEQAAKDLNTKPKGFIASETKPRNGRKDTVRVSRNPETGAMQRTIQTEDVPEFKALNQPEVTAKMEQYGKPEVPESQPVRMPETKAEKNALVNEFMDLTNEYLGKERSGSISATEIAKKYNDQFGGLSEKQKLEAILTLDGMKKTTDPQVQAAVKALSDQYDQSYNYFTKERGINMGFRQDYSPRIYDVNGQKMNAQEYKLLQAGSGRQKGRKAEPLYEDLLVSKDPAELLQKYQNSLEKAAAGKEYLSKLEKSGMIQTATDPSTTRGLKPIVAEGMLADGTIYYAKPDVANKLNKLFGSQEASGFFEKAVEKAQGFNSFVQSFVLSGGVPNTPINAFGIMQVMKSGMAGHPIQGGKAFLTGMSKTNADKFFNTNSKYVKMMAEQGLDTRYNYSIKPSKGIDRIKTAYDEKGATRGIGQAWDELTNDATFGRFMPALEVMHYKGVYDGLIAKKVDPKIAAKQAADATSNFFGKTTLAKEATGSKIGRDAAGAFLFAPRFRESMLNFWGKNVKALNPKNMGKIEYRDNLKFMAASAATWATMEGANKALTGEWMHDNPDGKKDKLLIPGGGLTGGKDIGIPFLPSIATVPRNVASGAFNLATGNLKEAGKNAQSFLSIPARTGSELLTNEDYFGSQIVNEDSTAPERLGQMASHVVKNNLQPWIREGLNAAGQNLGDDTKKTLGIKKQTPFETGSKSLEAPLRFYNPDYYKYGGVGLDKDQREMLRDMSGDQKKQFKEQSIKANKIDNQAEKEKKTAKYRGEEGIKKLANGEFYTKVGKTYKTFETETEAKVAKAKNDFKNSKDSERTIEGVKYRKTSSGTIVKATTPKPTTPKKSTKKTSSRKSSGGRGRQPSLDLLLKAISPVKVPAIKTAKLKSSAPKLPSMKTVKTPRVATRPRNRGNVTSTKVKIS